MHNEHDEHRQSAQHLLAAAASAAPFPFAPLVRSWQVLPRLTDAQLRRSGYTPLQVQLLHNRGRDIADISTTSVKHSNILDMPDERWRATGEPLADLQKAVERIRAAIAGGQRITVFGDYDCDGITACALLTSALHTLGAQVDWFVPTREDDGRGLNAEAVEQLAAQGTQLLITTDCGTANIEEVQQACSLGMEIIITDHHPLHGPPAAALALINPQRLEDHSANKDIAGVGVAFRLAEALANQDNQDNQDNRADIALREQLPGLLDLVAIGTIADVAPLTPENWELAHAGLARLNSEPRPGIAALASAAALTPGQITERDISFSLAPRLNAAGRLGKPELAMQLLLTNDAKEARTLAAALDELNGERQRLTDEVLRAARRQLGDAEQSNDGMLVVRGEGWPLGILGLVAGRLTEEYQRPAFVISSNDATKESRGSARGRGGVNLGGVLAAWPGALKRFGGHAQAAGFTIATDDLAAFTAYLAEVFSPALLESDTTNDTSAESSNEPIVVDCALPLTSVDEQQYRSLRALAPFGTGFPEPVFLTTGLRVLRCWQSGFEKRNLRLTLGGAKRRINFLWQRQGSLYPEIQAALPDLPLVDVVYTLDGFQRRDGFWELMPRILTLNRSTAS